MFLLFDIGGTNMRLALSDEQDIIKSKIIPTPKDFNEGLEKFRQITLELANGQIIEGVSGGIAGPLDKDKTMLLASPHISGWIQKPLKKELQKLFGCPVFLENDTAVGGIGEAVKGAGAGYKVVAYIAIGSGVGGKRIVDGKIDQTSFNFEPGHQIIVPEGKPCNCGGRGHLETYVGGAYNKLDNWEEKAKYLGIGLNNTIVHWDPDIVVLGGSVMKSLPLESVQKHLENILTIFPNKPRLINARLGDSAGFWGALELLKC